MQRNSVYVFLGALILLCSCSSPDKGNNDGDTLRHSHMIADTTTAVPETTEIPSQISVINREHYHTVEIRQMKFQPQELSVMKGDTIVWVNNGITAHDVTEQPDGKWTSSSMPVGASWQMVAKETTDYYCSIHVVMTGRILVR
ncbi:MAG: plastocyanin/azurin family copper-binding protein [Bacteroidota bacterium]|nr:plastocyanin/azurin family copper-binding protein [Bacteroidota bacterium]